MERSMAYSLAYSFRWPRYLVFGSVGAFFSGFLFMTPGICGGPGLLGFENDFTLVCAAILFLGGMGGFVVGLVWLMAVVVLRTIDADRERTPVDLGPRNP
jgi:hypothetical protein